MADFQWKGQWFGDLVTGSTVPYAENNNVTHNGIYYMCTSFAEVGSPSPDMDTDHWDVILRDGLSGSSGQAGSSGTSGVDGSSSVQTHWVSGEAGNNGTVAAGDVVTVGSDYVMIDTSLYTQGPDDDGYASSITIAGKTYSRDGKLAIFGDFVVYDSDIVNDGQIRVDGGLILEGEAQIEGNGIII
jgi:hypothetical protein